MPADVRLTGLAEVSLIIVVRLPNRMGGGWVISFVLASFLYLPGGLCRRQRTYRFLNGGEVVDGASHLAGTLEDLAGDVDR